MSLPQKALNMPKPGDQIANGRYILKQHISTGGGGILFRAKDTQSQKEVAVKLPKSGHHGENWTRFLHEVNVVQKLRHPNIVQIVDASLSHHPPYIAMEYLDEWQNLEEFLLKRGTLSYSTLSSIARNTLEGLRIIHNLDGRVHRDISPQNIMAKGRGDDTRIKIIDFGIAYSETSQRFTKDGQNSGRPHYMAPEVLCATTQTAPHPRQDLFALGTMLWFLATKSLPYFGSNSDLSVVISTYLRADLPRPRLKTFRGDLPQEFSSVVEKLVHQQPQFRPSSAAEVLAMLNPKGATSTTLGVRDSASKDIPISTKNTIKMRRLFSPTRETPGFEYSISNRGPLVRIVVTGYLDGVRTKKYLQDIKSAIKPLTKRLKEPIALVFIDHLDGFHPIDAAREHGKWFASIKSELVCVAIISGRKAMPVAASIGGLAANLPVRVFENVLDGVNWVYENI